MADLRREALKSLLHDPVTGWDRPPGLPSVEKYQRNTGPEQGMSLSENVVFPTTSVEVMRLEPLRIFEIVYS